MRTDMMDNTASLFIPSEGWKLQTKCLRCDKPFDTPSLMLRLYPCGHVLCADCNAMMVKRHRSTKSCDVCGSCIWRPSSDGPYCSHPVPHRRYRLADGPEDLDSEPARTAFFCLPGQHIGTSCRRCSVRPKLLEYTQQIQGTGLRGACHSYACLERGPRDVHGLEDAKARVDEVADLKVLEFGFIATSRTEDLRRDLARLGPEPNPSLPGLENPEVMFRLRPSSTATLDGGGSSDSTYPQSGEFLYQASVKIRDAFSGEAANQ